MRKPGENDNGFQNEVKQNEKVMRHGSIARGLCENQKRPIQLKAPNEIWNSNIRNENKN